MRFSKALLFFAILLAKEGFTASEISHLETFPLSPWFTGPLLTPASVTVPKGHFNIEPFTFFHVTTGEYDTKWRSQSVNNFYTVTEIIPLQAGFTHFMDGQIAPSVSHRFTKGEQTTRLDDLPFNVGFQLFPRRSGSLAPAVRLTLGASIPIGKYHKLDPDLFSTDSSGNGSWKPAINLVFGNIYQLSSKSCLSARFSLGYQAQTPVKVKGVNAFGGTSTTKGTAYPGGLFTAVLGSEYTITKKLVFATDVLYQYRNKSRFSGNPGAPGAMDNPISQNLSIAPALEYNFTVNVGMITGIWFSLCGRNSDDFTSGVIAINIFI